MSTLLSCSGLPTLRPLQERLTSMGSSCMPPMDMCSLSSCHPVPICGKMSGADISRGAYVSSFSVVKAIGSRCEDSQIVAGWLEASVDLIEISGGSWECAGLNRHEAGNESVLLERSSEPLGPEFCVYTARCSTKRKQGYRWAGY